MGNDPVAEVRIACLKSLVLDKTVIGAVVDRIKDVNVGFF